MTSKTIPNSEKWTDDETVLIDICEQLGKVPTNDPNCDGVCVCHVPKSLISLKPQAFIPQFVGLGPYHHFHADLLMTPELKLGVVKRVLKLKDSMDISHQRLQNIVFNIQPFYHEDMHSICGYRTLLYVFTVDGLFLLALLQRGVRAIFEESHTYFLTGKPGTMPLVSAAGVELTVDGIMMEVFMLENQIPTHVLKHLNRVNSMDQIDNLDSAMQNFCEALCPLVNVSNKLSKFPKEKHDHLLDLMYHLVAQSHPESESELESELDSNSKCLPQIFTYFIRVLKWIFLYSLILCWVLMLLTILIVKLGWWLVLSFLRWVIPCLPRTQSTLWQSFINIPFSTIYLFVGSISIIPYSGGIFRQIKSRTREWASRNYSESESETIIPSTATELHKANVKFHPSDGGISSRQFYDQLGSFILPCIRLDPTSDVIFRNLLAYESLTKSSNLIFAKFVKLLTTLIHSAEDVKLLVDKEIIQTRLSGEAVAQLFTEMGKSIDNGSAEIQELEQKIKEGVKAKILFDRLVRKFVMEFFIPFYIFFLVLYIYPWLLSVITSVYCMFHYTSGFRFCRPREDLVLM